MKHTTESEPLQQEKPITEQDWRAKYLEPALRSRGESADSFTTVSLRPVEGLYTPEDIQDIDFEPR